jgi:hypothetical protein
VCKVLRDSVKEIPYSFQLRNLEEIHALMTYYFSTMHGSVLQ